MLYDDLILQICNNYGLGKDIANIIHNYVLYLYCPALRIKQELFKFVNFAIETYQNGNYIRSNDFYKTGGGYGIMHRNIAGSYFTLPGKENIIDHAFKYCKHYGFDVFGYPGDSFHEYSLIHDFDYEDAYQNVVKK